MSLGKINHTKSNKNYIICQRYLSNYRVLPFRTSICENKLELARDYDRTLRTKVKGSTAVDLWPRITTYAG